MKLTFLLLTLLPWPVAFAAEYKPAPAPAKLVANATNRFTISGMHCDGCAKGIVSELKRTRGVVAADVSFTNRLAVVAYDTNRVTPKLLQAVIADAGYAAQPAKPTQR